jgi:tRNA(Ile)-lysidine synthase
VRSLQQRVLETIRKRELIKAGDRVTVAVSGGADSLALLRLLLDLRSELGIVLSVAHVNHKLRGAESDEDEQFVTELARQYELELLLRTAPVKRAQGTGIEAAARKLRYDFFLELARTGRANRIATGHTLDDQAETVLLRIFRGTGIRGLAGILPRLTLEEGGRACGEVVRPLLGVRREEIREFLRAMGQAWREDSSNQDPSFLRNKMRQRVLPALRQTFGGPALENLADLAEIARAEEEQWVADTGQWADQPALDLRRLLSLPLAPRRRLLRSWIEATAPDLSISFRVIEDILELAQGKAGRKLALAGGRVVRVAQSKLCWEDSDDTAAYEYVLPVPGGVEVRELSLRIEAVVTALNAVPEDDREQLLDPQKLQSELRIRNWHSGDRYWPANRKQAKKVKELLTERHAVGARKRLWPVIEVAGELVWMRDFCTPAALRPSQGAQKVLWIRVMQE